MSVESRKDITRKITKWETELWSYVSNGDGAHCPLYGCCRIRQRGGPCFDDNRPLLEWILQLRRSNPDNYLSIVANDANVLNFTEHWTPGRIFRLVERLAQNYLKKGGVSRPPVPAKLISFADKDSPVEVHLLPLKIYRGAIWQLNDRWVIQLKADDTRAMRRATLFHEVFHILAHCKATPIFNGPGREEAYFNELLADYFSDCVLMPREWVMEKWTVLNSSSRMAKIFDVSESQMWFRLKQLHLI